MPSQQERREAWVRFMAAAMSSALYAEDALGVDDALAEYDKRFGEDHEGLGVGSALPPDHYRVRVTYAQMPSMDDLKKEWGKDNVSDIFDGRPFTLHASCVGMDRTPGEKVFYVHDAGGDWESEERIAWGLKQRSAVAPNGYRPATHEETYEFAKAHPELVDFVGLGSFAVLGGGRYVAFVWRLDSQRVLADGWFVSGWRRRLRVLFVSK